MIKLIKSDEPCEYVADEMADIQNLPTSFEINQQGSKCFVIEDSSKWVLGGDAQWHQTVWYR